MIHRFAFSAFDYSNHSKPKPHPMKPTIFAASALIALTAAFTHAAAYDPSSSDTEQWTWTGSATGWQVGYVPDTSYLAGIRQTTKARYFFDLPSNALSLANQVTLNFTLPPEATVPASLLSNFNVYLVDDTTESVFYWFTPPATYAADHQTLFSQAGAPFPGTLDLDITAFVLGTNYGTAPTFRIEVTAYVNGDAPIALPSAPRILTTLPASIPEPASIGLLVGLGTLLCGLRRHSRPNRRPMKP